MWNAPHWSAARPSRASASRQSTSTASSAPYCRALSGTAAMSGSSYWPRSAVKAYGIAPFSRIHASAQHVSRPPEKAMPTRSPTGSEPRIDAAPFVSVTVGALEVVAKLGRRARRALEPSRTATKIVLSPAIVPATSGSAGLVDRVGERRRRSRAASGSRAAGRSAIIAPAQLRSAEASCSSRRRSAAPGSA